MITLTPTKPRKLFSSTLFKQQYNIKYHNITIHDTIPENQQSKGMIEGFHSAILKHLQILQMNKKHFNKQYQMPYTIVGYKNLFTQLLTKNRWKY